MLEHRDMAVQELQDEIVDTLQPAAGSGVGGITRQLFELVVDPSDHAVDPAVDYWMRPA